MIKKFIDLMGEYYKEQEYFTSRFASISQNGDSKWSKFKKALIDLYGELDYFYGGRKISNTTAFKASKTYKNIA